MIFGTDIILTDEGVLVFSEGIIHPTEPEIRTLKDMLPVLYDQEFMTEDPLYYRYKNIYFEEDEKIFDAHNIRYDLTVIPPGKLGEEFIKTRGHFHQIKNIGTETYTEYHEVLVGEAIFLLQKNGRNNEVEEVVAIVAQTGDKIYIPAGYGHVTINPSKEHLVIANLIAADTDILCKAFVEKSGAAYFYIETEDGKGDWIKNPKYQNSVALKIKTAPNQEQPICETKEKSLYDAFTGNPACFSILTT